MSVEQHSLDAIRFQNKLDDLQAKYGPNLAWTLLKQSTSSLTLAAGLDGFGAYVGLMDFNPVSFTFSTLFGLLLFWSVDGARSKYYSLRVAWDSTMGQIPHMRA